MDIYWISRLGSESIAAVAIGGSGFMLFWIVIAGMANATIAMVGNLVGGKDIEGANRLGREFLTMTLLVSLALAIVGYVAAPGLLRLLGASPQVWGLAIPYLRILMIGGIASFPIYIINAMLRGAGDMRLPMFIVCGGFVLHAILDPLLILGIGFPRLGVSGAAIASVISGAIGTAVGL